MFQEIETNDLENENLAHKLQEMSMQQTSELTTEQFGPFHCGFTAAHCQLTNSQQLEKVLRGENTVVGGCSPVSKMPQVVSFTGELSANEEGFEFYTIVEPDESKFGHLANWSGVPRNGLELKNNQAYLSITIVKLQIKDKTSGQIGSR